MGKNAADCCRIKLSMSKYGSHSALLLTKLCGDQDVWSGLDPGRDVQMLHKMGIPLPPWPDQPVDIAQHGIIPTILAAKWLILNYLPGCGQITLSATLSTRIRHLGARDVVLGILWKDLMTRVMAGSSAEATRSVSRGIN